jgi:hypothetical protein
MESDAYYIFLEQRRSWYKSIGSVYCPALRADIVFDSEGFNHLLYKGARKKRSMKEQMYKIGLLPLVIPVLKYSTNIETHSLRGDFEYWSLSKTVGKQDVEIEVILRKKRPGGRIAFYSVLKIGAKKPSK